MLNRIILVVCIFFTLCSFNVFSQEIPTSPEAVASGESLFNANCKACHRVKKKLVGPALAGIEDRAPSFEWIADWIRNSSKVIASGDDYGVKLFEEYNKSVMTSFPTFTDEDVLNMLAYIKAEAEKVETPVATATGVQAGGGPSSDQLTIILIGMVVILLILVVVLVLITSALKRYLSSKTLSEDDQIVVQSPYSYSSIVKSSGFAFIVVFVLVSIGYKSVIDGLYTIGVQKEYQPTQPIAFSHKIHAGQFAIDCQYCHTGASIGKQANIPSANICMNCHQQIQSGTNTGTTEIAKIFHAVGFDPSTASYTGKTEPIQWVRIHNLPDLAYFNHSQHVKVGGIACQQCHGPVEEMDEVSQQALLTMGWCVECHRTTNVNTGGNDYYSDIEAMHKTVHGKNAKLKVEDIGGLECSKCHY